MQTRAPARRYRLRGWPTISFSQKDGRFLNSQGGETGMSRPSVLMRVCVALLVTVAVGSARAETVADFYRGKTIQIYVGYGAGGGYDAYARLIARHLGRHIPGQPSVVVQNMPG